MNGRMISRRLFAAGALLGLGACGFRPLHQGGGGSFHVALSGESGRLGRHFRESWRRLAGETGDAPLWLLEVDLAFSDREVAISDDDNVTRYDVIGKVGYKLVRAQDEERTADEGVISAESAYSTLGTPYATRVARRDVEKRVAQELAERLFATLAPRLTAP